MTSQGQLEIIRANGDVEFYPLDSGRGVINIGRHPENDIVFDSPGVAPFHAVIDHRQPPYQLVVLSHQGQTALDGRPLPPNSPVTVPAWANIQFDGHTIILVDDGPAGTPARPAAPAAPTTRPEGPAVSKPKVGTVFFKTPPADVSDEVIITELSEREQSVPVEQSASFQLTIVNGGDLVASFTTQVQGVPADWVEITPPQVNLYEGNRAAVTVTITPPRLTSSRAGLHHLAVIVSSPNHPGRYSRRGFTLTVEPFFDFTVGELSPKRQSLSWFKESGAARISITNKGNSNAPFRIAGEDDEHACSFEFDIPGEPVGLARQADLSVAPDETVSIPMSITPHKRRLIGMRRRTHNLTVTTTLLEGQQTPRSLLGELKTGPLIGPLLIFLIILLFISMIIYFFWPDVTIISNPRSVTAGQEVTLGWSAFPPFFVTIELNGEAVEVPRGNRSERPIKTTTYEVVAETWLSSIFPFFSGRDQATVQVTPVKPDIGLFRADPIEMVPGDTSILSWFVVGADELTLIHQNTGTEDDLNDPAGSIRILAEEEDVGVVVMTLKAVNASMPDAPVQKSVEILVTTPTPVPVTPPVIEKFLVQPQVITPGQTVLVQWSVTGAESVSVQPLGDGLPPLSPPIAHNPQETTLYVLSASNGEETVNAVQQVLVNQPPPPTPTPPPDEPPAIEFFGITPEEFTRVEDVRDDPDNEIMVQLNWVVTGKTTNVEITGGPPGYEKLSNLSRVGDMTLNVMDTTVFVLTAYNGEEMAVETTEIKFLDPEPAEDAAAGDDAAAGGGGGDDGAGPDPPDIGSFIAEGVSASDDVTAAGGDPPVYNVVAGSNVNLKWSVDNADTVTLVGVGDQPPAGTYTLFNVVADQTYQLTATGEGGTTDSSLQIKVLPKPPPPAPFNVQGTVSGSDIILTWDHSAENDIIGFRVYRTTSLGGTFTRVADESMLGNGARQWTDVGPLPVCTGYYMTAVYIDPLSGDKLETGASANSWYSGGC